MRTFLLSFVGIICFLHCVRSDYIAAVVEHAPIISVNNITNYERIEENLNEYIYYIEQAKNRKAEIIVFPEYGLTGMVQDPTEWALDVNSTNGTFNSNIILRLSNAAKEHDIYIIVNLLEKEEKQNKETIYYNTNLVFNKMGNITAKYRKINLFDEPNLTAGSELVTFTTDSGVVFGLFTCADILYHHPARTILANTTARDIIFPTAWYSTLPFFHSLSIQSGYSSANGVNLLASNMNNPSAGMGGSGIYGSDGIVWRYYMSGTKSSKLLVSTVKPSDTKTPSFSTFGFEILDEDKTVTPDIDNFVTRKFFENSKYVFEALDLSKDSIKKDLCFNSFCCNFTINVQSANTSEIYQMVAYDGPFDDPYLHYGKFCALLNCETSDLSSCGTRNVTGSTKLNITISTNIPVSPEDAFQPITLTKKLTSVFNTTFSSDVANEIRSIRLSSKVISDNIIAFGIISVSGTSTFGISFVLILATSIIKYIL